MRQAIIESPVRNAGMNSPFFKAESFSVDSKSKSGPSVSTLRSSISPNAILRLIVSIVVFAFKSKFGWAWSHIFKKISEVHPSRANRNSSTAPIFISSRFRIKTTALHVSPYIIFTRYFVADTMAVFSFAKRCIFASSASATFANAAHQLIRSHRQFCSAIAMTLPPFVGNIMRYGPTAKSNAFKLIFRSRFHNPKHIINEIIKKQYVTA